MLSPSHAVAVVVAIAGITSNDEATADVISKVAIIAVVVLESAESDSVAAAHIAAREPESQRECLVLDRAITETEGNVEGVFIDEDIQWVKKLSQCLLVLKRKACGTITSSHMTVKILGVTV